ncbi:hypothetical protein [Paractinoplanes atraurantiacus]|uniref:Lipoprotein n=1 Tax=Paractinoplanes atraurantiacus TaxID=1036182 RepID=A0A285HQP4_9ACTN|nr:hypothetical protein [Actinoplanes atraurantiacus]SNY38052.1 hypothetical protein SAMN05421748_105174 [Actinoplanes atraurantiacus]
MFAKRIVTVLATLLAIPGLGACGSAAAETRRDEPAAIAPVPASGARAVGRDLQAAVPAAAAPRNVPAAFPLPPGSRVTSLSDPESGASFVLSAPDPEAVLSFYRRELARGAFTLVADRAASETTSLAFREAQGWAGTIFATTHRVTVAVKRA